MRPKRTAEKAVVKKTTMEKALVRKPTAKKRGA